MKCAGFARKAMKVVADCFWHEIQHNSNGCTFDNPNTMKIPLFLALITVTTTATSQSVVGTWQQTEHNTCFKAEFEESETEKELAAAKVTSSSEAVATLLTFGEKNKAEQGVYSAGKKKPSSLKEFRYQVSEQELQYLDKKSGIITSRFIIDELTATTLRFHDAAKDCETWSYTKVK
jgi:hypothetical protein